MRQRLIALLLAVVAVAGSIVVGPAAPAHAAAATADTSRYWNGILLELFRLQGGGPTTLSRSGAIMHAAVFDAINSAWWTNHSTGTGYNGYLTIYFGTPGIDEDLAAGLVARGLLRDQFPSFTAQVDQAYTARHGTATPPAGTQQLADFLINLYRSNRADDGSTSPMNYTPDGVPGSWRPTGNPPCKPTVTPGWGKVRPFSLNSGSQFRQPLPGGFTTYPALLASSLYAANVAKVRSVGRFNSTTRTAQQTAIAHFWANDLDGTYKPPGQLLEATDFAIKSKAVTDGRAASRIFALTALSLADAAIAAWDMKFLTPIDLWRPESAIQMDATNPDPTWQPLSADRNGVHFSPCFASWVSGHATLAGAWTAVMKRQFGDANNVTISTDDPFGPPGVLRTYTSFSAAGTEDAQSRIFLGVHYPFDADGGLTAGSQVGTFVYTNEITPLTCNNPCG